MSGITLSTEEMRHFDITKDRVLARRESMIDNEPRVFIILCSVNQAGEIAENHDVVFASPGRYDHLRRAGLEGAKKGTIFGPHGGFRLVPK